MPPHHTHTRTLCPLRLLWPLLALLAWPCAAETEAPVLRVVFGERTATVSGRVPSDAAAESLAAAVSGVRPDLALDRSGLSVDPAVKLPADSDLRSLVAELGLSTHEGRLEIWDRHLVVGGLTDSLVTRSALRIRAEPFLVGRELHDQICIVDSDDLPSIDVALSKSPTGAGADPGSPPPVAEQAFEVAGIRLEKLLPAIRMLSRIDELAGRAAPPATTLRAQPLEAAPQTVPAGAPQIGMAAVPATMPVARFETLPSVFFSRNSFLLQANQEATLDELAKLLASPPLKGASIRVEAVKASGGSSAFNDYLCERRTAEVARLLAERGVEPGLVATATTSSPSAVDGGEVRVQVEIPPPPPPPAAADMPAAEAPPE